MIEFESCSIAHLGPLMLPKVRCDRSQRPWWEAARLHSMRHFLGEGDRLLDVGAEMGDMSALFASWGVDVFLVEPNPKAWPWLRATFEANNLEPAGWFTGMLGSPERSEGAYKGGLATPRSLKTIGMDPWPRDDFLRRFDYDNPTPETSFHHLTEHSDINPIYTVDELVEETGFHPTAITADIEGGEIEVIEGIEGTLLLHRPKVWISIHEEFIQERYGVTSKRVFDVFEHCGYTAVYLAHDHEAHWMFLPEELNWTWS